jgi:tetratricopeptide (TPR) repeat protein
VPLLSLYHGLLYIFEEYDPSAAAFVGNVSALVAHFEEFSRRLGVEVLPPEAFVNQFGYALLQREAIDEAIEVFELNVQNYPGSFNAYDSLAEAYLSKGDKVLARQHYEKSLELNPASESGRKQLEALEAADSQQ